MDDQTTAWQRVVHRVVHGHCTWTTTQHLTNSWAGNQPVFIASNFSYVTSISGYCFYSRWGSYLREASYSTNLGEVTKPSNRPKIPYIKDRSETCKGMKILRFYSQKVGTTFPCGENWLYHRRVFDRSTPVTPLIFSSFQAFATAVAHRSSSRRSVLVYISWIWLQT